MDYDLSSYAKNALYYFLHSFIALSPRGSIMLTVRLPSKLYERQRELCATMTLSSNSIRFPLPTRSIDTLGDPQALVGAQVGALAHQI